MRLYYLITDVPVRFDIDKIVMSALFIVTLGQMPIDCLSAWSHPSAMLLSLIELLNFTFDMLIIQQATVWLDLTRCQIVQIECGPASHNCRLGYYADLRGRCKCFAHNTSADSELPSWRIQKAGRPNVFNFLTRPNKIQSTWPRLLARGHD